MSTLQASCGGGSGGGGSVDVSFNFPKAAFDGGVFAIAPAADASGDVYVGGFFARYAENASGDIVALNPDASVDGGFDAGTGFDGWVSAIAPTSDGSGDVYVGGNFTSYDGTISSRIIRLNADGTVDPDFDVGTGFDFRVDAIALATDASGDLYVGGGFSTYDGTASSALIRLDADGTPDAGFDVGSGFSFFVSAIAPAMDASGDVYVGGSFSTYNGTAAGSIIRLDADGTPDAGFTVGTGFDANVLAIAAATDGSGDVYVGGSFTEYDGAAAPSIVRLDADGSIDPGFDVGTGFDGHVRAIAPARDGSGDVYVGGFFIRYDGRESSRIVRLDADGTVDAGFDVGTGFDRGVLAIAPLEDGSGDVYVGGSFLTYDGQDSQSLIALNADGTLDAGFAVAVGRGFDDYVSAIAPAADASGDVYLVGGFLTHDVTGSSYVARLDANGRGDAGFDVGFGFNLPADAIAPAADASGDVYVGGSFTSYDGSGARAIIRLGADGTRDGGFDVGTGFNGRVLAIAPAPDASGDVYVGGIFNRYDGSVSRGIVRLDADGARDTGFDVGTGFDSPIAIAVITPAADSSGDVYVGGGFTEYDGTGANRIIRLDADGTRDPGFDAGTGFDGSVLAIAPATDGSGDVYVGGAFTGYNGTAANRIIRLHADGTPDAGFDVGTGFDGDVLAITPTATAGDVYVGGSFTSYDGTGSSFIIALHADGTVDAGFDVGTGFDGSVLAIALAADGSGDVYVGGSFASYDGTRVDRAAALNPDGSLD